MSSFSGASFLTMLFSVLALMLILWPGQNSVEAIPINQLRAAYPPISDAYLRTLLGYGEMEEQPRGLLLIHRPPILSEDGQVANFQGSHGATQILVAKRKNAELVNHILKNFASLNRLGDAGK